MKPKPQVNQTLYMLDIGNMAIRGKKMIPYPVIVSRVGRKYFAVHQPNRSFYSVEFHIDTWREHSEFSANHRLYESMQEWENEDEIKRISQQIYDYFPYGNNVFKLSIKDLRTIKAILDDHEKQRQQIPEEV